MDTLHVKMKPDFAEPEHTVNMKIWSDTGIYVPDENPESYERLMQVLGWGVDPNARWLLQLRLRVGRYPSQSRLWAETLPSHEVGWQYYTGISHEMWWMLMPGYERHASQRTLDWSTTMLKRVAAKAHEQSVLIATS